ncbi:DUF402 domain-containing protein [Actinoplanes sp. NPDC026670]|uniref:DUF402 domain-containing protein n=1 Tax=Actinoplanes sp. NPDC026670 TaxID=3154700 RepID=UPI0033EB2E92
MRYVPGQTVTRRYLRGEWLMWAQAMRVIRDDADGLLLWQPVGGDFAKLVDADGTTAHEVSPDAMSAPELVSVGWLYYDVLILMPPDAAHSVWWFFQNGTFAGWYVNLESPFVRRGDAVETTDHVLDVVATAQREWQWKDEHEFAGRIGHPLYFDADEAPVIRAEGERLIKLIEAAEFPFDDTYTGFRPDPAWPVPRFPEAG